MKQTAVEWLCNEWLYIDQEFDMKLIDKKTYWERLRSVQEQDKEMEKEQMERAYQQGGIYAQNNFKIRIMNILNPTTAVLAWKAIYYTTKFS